MEEKRKRPFKPRRGPEAPRNQLAQVLREMIHSGGLAPGASPPAERTLALQNGVHRDTVRRAFAQLEREGLLEKGERGWRVCRAAAQTSLAPFLSGAVLVVTPGGAVQPEMHQQPGWSDWLVMGAMEQIRSQGSDAFLMAARKLLELPVAELAASGIRGMLVLDYSIQFREVFLRAQALRESGVPVVVYGNDPAFSSFDRVYSDQAAGVRKLLGWLAGRGVRRALMLLPEGQAYWQLAREEGFRRGLAEYGFVGGEVVRLPPDDPAARADGRAGYERNVRFYLGYLADRLLAGGEVGAVLLPSDGNLFPVAGACRLMGCEPGRDILLCGYDNYWQGCEERAYCDCAPAATVDKHNYRMGQLTGELLRLRLAGDASVLPLERVEDPALLIIDNASVRSQEGLQKER